VAHRNFGSVGRCGAAIATIAMPRRDGKIGAAPHGAARRRGHLVPRRAAGRRMRRVAPAIADRRAAR